MTTTGPTPAPASPDEARVELLARLARINGEDLRELLDLLEEPRWNIRRGVIAALGALGEIALPGLCRTLREQRRSEMRIAATVDALVASSGDVESSLFELAASDNPAIAADVAQILGRRRNPRAVPTLIGLLHHTDDNVAVAAIEALGRVGGRSAVDALVESVKRDYFFRTYPAIDVLGRSGDPRAVAPLALLLHKPQYVLEAARALGRTADRHAVVPLCGLLLSPTDAHVRVAALALTELLERHRELYGSSTLVLEALRHSTDEAAVRRVSQALAGGDSAERVALCTVLGASQREAAAAALAGMLDGAPLVARAAAIALEQLGRRAAEELSAALQRGDSARRQILLPLFPKSGRAAEVLQCLQDPDATVRAMACEALARMGDPSIVASLFDHLGDSNPRVAQAAVSAIQSLGILGTEAMAVAAARSPEARVRRSGLRILSYFGFANALDVFVLGMNDADARVQDVAIAGLAFLDVPRARELLLGAAADPEARARAAAMRGLGQSVASDDVAAALSRGLEDADAWVRYYACQSLGKLRRKECAGSIAKLLSDSAGQVRVAAVEALSHLKSAPALDALRGAAGSDEPDVKRAALIGLGLFRSAETLPVLTDACADPDAATRLVALSALSAFTSAETLPVVARALQDQDEGVRAAAIGLLASWPDSAATRLLTDAMRNEAQRPRIVQALATVVPGRVDGLLAALAGADDELAPVITSVLGRVDPSDACGSLLAALELPNVPARKAAAAMLAARGTREALAALTRRAVDDPSEEVRRVCALLLVQ